MLESQFCFLRWRCCPHRRSSAPDPPTSTRRAAAGSFAATSPSTLLASRPVLRRCRCRQRSPPPRGRTCVTCASSARTATRCRLLWIKRPTGRPRATGTETLPTPVRTRNCAPCGLWISGRCGGSTRLSCELMPLTSPSGFALRRRTMAPAGANWSPTPACSTGSGTSASTTPSSSCRRRRPRVTCG